MHGGEAVKSAEHVAKALARWHERGAATADLAFWRQHLEGFRSPKAFALVVDALLRKQDYRAAMALLINWLSQMEQVPLDEGEHSFHTLALRWLLGWTSTSPTRPEAGDLSTEGNVPVSLPVNDRWPLVLKFFDYLEANADEYWQVPVLESDAARLEAEEAAEDSPGEIYSAAYENVTYHDSTDDDQEGSIIDGSTPEEDFDLEAEEAHLTAPLAIPFHFGSFVADRCPART